MRKGISLAARKLPPKHVVDRIMPWVALILSIVAGAFALYQYTSEIQSTKVLETIKLYREFVGSRPDTKSMFEVQKSLIDLNDKLGSKIDKTRCSFIKELKEKNKIQTDIQTGNCDSEEIFTNLREVSLDNDQRRVLRENIIKIQNSYSTTNKIQLYRILGFYNSVVTCAKHNGCDENTITELFSEPIISFINAYCQVFEANAKKWGTDISEDDILVRFLLDNGVSKTYSKNFSKGRTKLFKCEKHRKME